jgi:anti-sigma B factor antagonist
MTHANRTPFAFSHREPDARTSVVGLEGDLDLASAPRLKWALVDLIEAGHNLLVVDLARVTFMDSTALGVLIGVNRRLAATGILAIACPQRDVIKLFEVTGLDKRLQLFPTVDAALARVHESPPRAGERSEPAEVLGDQSAEVESASTAEGRRDSSPREPAEGEVPLTGDAAVVLGIASTAMPFARAPEEQVERWLRALRPYGDAGVALTALGVGEAPAGQAPVRRADERPRRARATDPDVVATVTQHARRIARRRRASTIGTSDLLGAVMEVYGSDFDRVLALHGIERDAVTERLGLGLPGPLNS